MNTPEVLLPKFSIDAIRKRREALGLPAQDGKPWQGPLFNQDSTEFFYTNRPEEISGELIDQYIDLLAHAGIGAFVSCVNAQRANYASQVWEPIGTDMIRLKDTINRCSGP